MKKNYLPSFLKLLVVFLISSSLYASAAGYSQTITLKAHNLSLIKALDAIRQQTDYAVYVNLSYLSEAKPVTLNATNMPLEEYLNKVLSNQPLKAIIEDKTIILSKKNPTDFNVERAVETARPIAQITVTGQVTSLEDGNPVTASISIKGTTKGVSTDLEGNYKLTGVKPDDVLIFSSVGYENKEISVGGRSQISVKMALQLETLNQVMVVAYGTAKKSTFTGSAAVIGEETFKNRPSTEISQALTGSTPGLQIGTSNGQPGSEPTIRIRGIGSFNASNDPLIILDGVPYDNALSSINPNDIESVTVLKDASSAALYGSRGANGVLLINTKKGKAGKPKVDAKYNFGLTSRQSSDYERLNDRDYMELYWEATRNSYVLNGQDVASANAQAGSALLAGLGYNPYLMPASTLFDSNGKLNPAAVNHWAEDTDWYGGITRTGRRHDANFSISGGGEKGDYYTSLGYVQEEGFIKGSVYDRLSAKGNVNSQITKWLKIGSNLTYAYAKSNGEQSETSGAISNPFRATRYLGNIFPIHLHDPNTGEYILDVNGDKIPDFGSGWTSNDGTIVIGGRDGFAGSNHPFEVNNTYRGGLRHTVNLKGYADVTLAKGLKFTANGSLGANVFRSWSGDFIYPQKGNAGAATQNTSNTTTWNFQQLLTYAKDFGKHHFDVLAGHESYKFQYWYMSTSMKTQTIAGNNYEYANFNEINANPNSYTHNLRIEGYLSRLNYDYNEKYFASASYRKDASSRFSPSTRWGDFWSAGAGWAIDKESFMDNIKFVNQLKLRVSYGVVGNDGLDNYYPWRATYAPSNNGEPGYVQASLGNRALTWETSKNFDAGIDFALLKNRLTGTVEVFNRQSSDLLFNVPQPISSGIGSIVQNAGTMYNKGIELSLDGKILKSNDWSISLNANSTFLKNKLTSLPVDPYSSSIYKIQAGHSRYDYWLREWYGVNPATGFNLYRADLDQFTFTPAEIVEIDGVSYTENIEKSKYDFRGSALPKLTGGFGTDVSYKNFNLRVNFYYQLGSKFYDAGYRSFMVGSLSYASQHVDMLKRWRNPGDKTDVPMVTAGTNTPNIEAGNSTRWLVSANMLELTNVNLSYNLPAKFLKSKNISSALIYFSANNAWLVTARNGLYPRRNFNSGYTGNDDVYPPSTIASFGLNLTF